MAVLSSWSLRCGGKSAKAPAAEYTPDIGKPAGNKQQCRKYRKDVDNRRFKYFYVCQRSHQQYLINYWNAAGGSLVASLAANAIADELGLGGTDAGSTVGTSQQPMKQAT